MVKLPIIIEEPAPQRNGAFCYACLYGLDLKLHLRCPCSDYDLCCNVCRFWRYPAIASGHHWTIFYNEQQIAVVATMKELEEWKQKLHLVD